MKKQKTNKCGDCACLITDEGEPYYCAAKDLYTLVKASDPACEEFILTKEKKDNGRG